MKRAVFDRILNYVQPFEAGDRVKIKGTNKVATVVEIVSDYDRIKWQGMTPYFIAYKADGDTQEYLANYKQLRKRRK